MGAVGVEVVERVVPGLKAKEHIDLVIAQAENVTEGRGISPSDFNRLQAAGVDFCTGRQLEPEARGNYSVARRPRRAIIRPANYPAGTPGLGYKYIETSAGNALIISLLGSIVGKDAERATDNPLKVIDRILHEEIDTKRVATIVNFHGDYSSEKVVIGHYLDGRVSAVIGDHWHVPTADARVLPGGTAHISDVGMCGALDSSLGVTYASIIPRCATPRKTRNVLETTGPASSTPS